MHRFFIPPDWIKGTKVTFIDEVAHQIRNVLRLRAGRRILVLDNSGSQHEVELSRVARNVVIGEVRDSRPASGEPGLKLILYQSVLKAQKFEWVLQKGTELGIHSFVPVITERAILADVETVDEKAIRWRRIIKEAAEQSGRGILPQLRGAMMFPQACQEVGRQTGLHLLAWEDEAADNLRETLNQAEADDRPAAINLFIGSEGGFTLDEARLAHRYGINPVWLGRRIFRAETAGLLAGAAIFYHFGEFE